MVKMVGCGEKYDNEQITMSEIRKYFTSRFDNGHIMEFDFSQLEVICLAHLSQDKQLIKDIRDGIDMHRVMAAKLFSIPESEVTPAQRKKAKQLTFQLQYGAGYKSMAKSTKLSQDLCKKFINNYYERYKGVLAWQRANIKKVESLRVDSGTKTPMGFPKGVSTLVTETGRRFTFYERDIKAMPWVTYPTKPTGFFSTEIKNYPVQGFATGDIVPMVLGKVYRALKACNPEVQANIKMINTVHDSIVFDVNNGYQYNCYDIVHPVMERVAQYLMDDFGIEFDMPITVDCQIGDDWMDMTEYRP